MRERMNEIIIQIDKLTVDLLVPARVEKTINREAFNKLYLLLDEVQENVKGSNSIDRKLAGLLFFIYTSIQAEAEHCSYPNALFLEAGKLEEYLSEILWDSPFEGGR